MKRKLLIFFIALITVTSCAIGLAACNADENDGFDYSLNDDRASYSVVGNGCSGDVVIPSEHDGLPVTYFKGFYKNHNEITSITIPESITKIKGLNYTSNTNTIFTFSGLNSLNEITISEDNNTFKAVDNCIIETTTKTLVFGYQKSVIPNDGSVTYIGENAFRGCTALTSIVIPDTVTEIGRSAFLDCSGLTDITLSQNLASINPWAFNNCSLLKNLIIPDSVQYIGEWAFSSCSSLNTLTIGLGVKDIGDYAFRSCVSLTDINFNATKCNNLADMNGSFGAFNNAGKNSDGINLTIGANVTYIPAAIFTRDSSDYLSANIKTVTFAGNSQCEYLGYSAFANCTNLESINLPDSLLGIGEDVFRGAAFTEIAIPANVNYIGKRTFSGCASLTSVTFTNPNDWKIWLYYAEDRLPVEGNLSDPAVAANLLTSNYSKWTWDKGISN